jgi:thiamine monophosphate synthase
LIDKALSKSVGIVILTSNQQTGGQLYEAACLLKSLIRDRAYLLVAERVDIAAAALTSGVLLSDQGSFSFTISPLLSINTKYCSSFFFFVLF